MSKGIGDIIIKLRMEAGYTQEQLCAGICAVSTIARIEGNELVPDYFLLDRIFERLGRSAERLEYVLSSKVYTLYELRYRIQEAILYRDFVEAEELLAEYEGIKVTKKELHTQFIQKERAQIAWLTGESTEKVLEYLNYAIEQTVRDKSVLGAEELKLLLFRWEVCQGTGSERASEEIWKILEYIEKSCYGTEEKASVYPYAALLIAKYAKEQMSKVYIKDILKNALELLRDEGRIHFMVEILEEYVSVLEEIGQTFIDDEDTVGLDSIEELKEIQSHLFHWEKKFDIHLEKFRLFQYLNRLFELDYEMIRSNRMACNMTQEELCEDICSVETLSRIERGKCSPNNNILEELLRKMERSGQRVGMIVTAERFETVELQKQIWDANYRHEYKTEEVLLEKLQETLDMTWMENRQYIAMKKLRYQVRNKIIDYRKGIGELYKIFQMTFHGDEQNIFNYRLTMWEYHILGVMALYLVQIKEYEKAIWLWRRLVESYEESDVHQIFRLNDWERICINLVGTLIVYNEKFIDEIYEINCKIIKATFEAGRGKYLGDILYGHGQAMKWKNPEKCVLYLRQARMIYKLLKMNVHEQHVDKYMKENGLKWEGYDSFFEV